MPLPDLLTTSGIVLAQKAVQTVAQSTLVDSVRNGVVDFLTKQVQDLGKKELADRIAGMRSDAKLRGQIQNAIERATKRWTEDYADRDFVIAVAQDTQFADLPSVQAAVQAIARNPLNPVPVETLRGKFAEVLPKRFESERTERGVVDWLEILREEFVGVSDLRQALAVAAEIQTARSTGLAAEVLLRLEAILSRMEAGPTPTEQTLRDYLHWVIDQHYYLDPRGTMQTVRQVQVRLQDVYVSLEAEAQAPLSTLDRRLFEHELESLVERDDLTPEAKEDLRENLQARYATEEARLDTKPVELAELARKHAKLVILGDPGAGKTTLLRYLALRHAQALCNGEAELPDQGPVRLPLYLRIANYAEQNHGRSLVDYVPACVRGQENADPALAALVRERLERGQCLILLDGLDEVIEPSQRAEIAAQIDALIRAHEHAGNRFVVTSRVAGYRTASLAGDMPHYCVRDMNDAQIQRFLEQWCSAVERFQTPELAPEAQAQKAQAEIDDITKAIKDNPGVKRLATNPLLLRVLALIHRTGARLPQRRIELYRLAADTLIRDWELARGIPQAALVREADANRLLAELAAWMHQEKPAGIATEGEVKAQLANVVGQLQGKDADHPDVQSAVDDFLTRIRQHTGLFVERAPRRYGFMHLTFEEYFAARWLVAKPREAAKRIRNKLHRPRWEEPILLSIGFYGMEFPDAVDDLVEEAILGQNLGGRSPYEDILHRDLLFAVRVMGDQDMNPNLRRKLEQDLMNLWFEWESRNAYRPLRQQIGQVMSALRDSRAESDLQEVLLPFVQAGDSIAYKALGHTTLSTQSVVALLSEKATDFRFIISETFSEARLSPEAIAALLAILQDKGSNARTCAIDILGISADQPKATTALSMLVKDESEDIQIRAHAAYALRKATSQTDVIATLLAALKDENGDVRAEAADALGSATSRPEVITALLDALQDKDSRVRLIVADVLGNAASQPDVFEGLVAALKDESAAYSAAKSLGRATLSTGTADLIATLRDTQKDTMLPWDVYQAAKEYLGQATPSTEAIADLVASVREDDILVGYEAARALGNITLPPESIAELSAILRDGNSFNRSAAALALSNTPVQPQIATLLLAALKDNSEEVRGNAARALGSVAAQPEVTAALLAVLEDESEYVRTRAAAALGNAAAQTQVLTALFASLHDKYYDVKASAAYAISQLARHPQMEIPTDFPDQIATMSLDYTLHETNRWSEGSPADRLFDALMAVAPGPTVP